VTADRTGGEEHRGGEGADARDARLQALLSVDLAESTAPARRRRPEAVAEPAPLPSARRGEPVSVASWVVLAALLVAGLGLTYAGTRIIRASTEGEVVEPVDDPTAPGYEALVQPTPTLAVLHDLAGTLDSITVLTLPDAGRGGGGVVLVPTRTVDDLPLFGAAPLETPYDLGSTPQVQAEVVGDVLGVGIDEVVVVDAERWAGLVAPVAPLVLDNPADVEVDGDVLFEAGEVRLGPADVGPFLEARGDDESDLDRLYRHELLWRAWLDAVAAEGSADAVPGELESGLGRFVRALAAGAVDLETMPVDRGDDDPGDEPTFVPDVDGIASMVARLVPFPRSPRPGVRQRVRVLNGTDDLEAARRLAPELPPLGLEVVIVGNAATLDHERTTIAYVGPEQQEAAEDVRALLGAGEVVVDPRPSDVVDITVTLGADHE